MNIVNTILNLIFPVNCVLCGKPGEDLCSFCLANFPQTERKCADWIFPIFDYRYLPLKNAIHLLKYKGRKRLAGVFAMAMRDRILEELSELKEFENFIEPVLIPIPLSRKRMQERGFNQAELICRHLIAKDNNNFELVTNALLKTKETEHQARIGDRRKRLANLVDSFSVKDSEKIKGRNIILIDDVTTTGATLIEAKKVLKAHGARKIIAFTAAH